MPRQFPFADWAGSDGCRALSFEDHGPVQTGTIRRSGRLLRLPKRRRMAAEYFSRDGGRELEAGHPVGKGERKERGPARKKPEAEATRAKMTTARGDGATAAEADGPQRRRRGGGGGRREGAGGRQGGGGNIPLLWVEVARSSPYPLGANAREKPTSTSARHTQEERPSDADGSAFHLRGGGGGA